MKRKITTHGMYFLRGLGVGIAFTGLMFAVLDSNPSKPETVAMTKEEIIEKAKEYGMVEDMDFKLDEIMKPTESPSPSPTLEPTTKPSTKPTTSPEVTPTLAPTIRPQYGVVTIEIERGDSMKVIAHKLNDAELIEDTDRFIAYVTENEYAPKIIAGTYEIQKGSSYSTIVKKLRGK